MSNLDSISNHSGNERENEPLNLAARFTIGRPFNPWRGSCGFYPPDKVSANTMLKLTDGQKRLYERCVRWAGRKGVVWHGCPAIAEALGKCVRQVSTTWTPWKKRA